MPRFSPLAAALCAAVLAVSAPAAVRAQTADAAQLQTLVAKQSPSVVTVKAVLKTDFKGGGQSQSQESRTEMQGTVVDATGLIMISSAPFSTDKIMEMMGAGGAMPAGMGIKITPTSFQIVFADDPKEYSAFLAATDATLGLAFVQVENLNGKTLTAIDWSAAPTPAVGDQLVTVSRLSKGYDYAPFFETARVSGLLTKPRAAFMLDGGISELGLPVFTPAGAPVGVLTSIASGVKADAGGGDAAGMAMFLRMFGGGTGGANKLGLFVVPGAAVQSVIAQAKTRAVEVAAQRAKSPPAPAARPAAKPPVKTAPVKP